MLPEISRPLRVFALFTCLAYTSGSSCTNLCPGPFNAGKCCDDEFQITTLSSTNDTETDGFQNSDGWPILTGSSSLIGILLVILIICLCCPGCSLYKRVNNGAVYRRFGRSGNPSGRKRKNFFNRGRQNPKTSVPTTNETPSVTVIASHPVQVNVSQSCAPGQMIGQTVYNHPPQPQGPPFQTAMQSPPPCTVAVICDSHHTQPAYNPMYRQ